MDSPSIAEQHDGLPKSSFDDPENPRVPINVELATQKAMDMDTSAEVPEDVVHGRALLRRFGAPKSVHIQIRPQVLEIVDVAAHATRVDGHPPMQYLDLYDRCVASEVSGVDPCYGGSS